MAELVEILPWQELPPLMKKLRECVTNYTQLPEWVTFRWRPFSNIFIAALREAQSGDLIAVTPLVEHKEPLQYWISGQRLATWNLNGLLLWEAHQLFHVLMNITRRCVAPCWRCHQLIVSIMTLPKTSAFLRFLTKEQKMHSRKWLLYTPRDGYRYYYIDMSTSYDEYLCKFKPSTRQKFRRKVRQLEKEAGECLELVRVSDTAEVPDFLAAAHDNRQTVLAAAPHRLLCWSTRESPKPS